MVSKKMLDKLKLHCDKHPHPYRNPWFKKGNEVIVNKRCLIKFSMGKTYKDEVWCDVIAEWMHVICCWGDHGNMTEKS